MTCLQIIIENFIGLYNICYKMHQVLQALLIFTKFVCVARVHLKQSINIWFN